MQLTEGHWCEFKASAPQLRQLMINVILLVCLYKISVK